MRVVILNHFFYPDEAATAQLNGDLAQALAECEELTVIGLCGVTRYALKEKLTAGQSSWGKVSIHRLSCTDFGTKTIPGRLSDYATFFLQALRYLLFGPKSDLVIAMTSPPLIVTAGVLAKIFRGTKLIYWVQDLYPEIIAPDPSKRGKPIYSILMRIAQWVDTHTDIHVVPGECMRETLRKRQRGRKMNIEVIPNWSIVPVSQKSEMTTDQFRQKWNLQNSFVIMYSGNLGRAHDWSTIAEGFAQVHALHPAALLVMIGYGYGKDRLVQWHKMHPTVPVIFLPHQPRADLATILGSADIHLISQSPEFDGLVVPSKFYGIASVFKPVHFIGSPENTLSKKILTHSLGSISPAGQPAPFASAILKYISEPELATQCSSAMKAWYESQSIPSIPLAHWKKVVRLLTDLDSQ